LYFANKKWFQNIQSFMRRKCLPTNDFAKKLTASEEVDEFTVIVAENQLIGRGQKTNSWHSKESKN
jgi:biotin-(acetyl-CoA carboxylase) ligase